MSKSLVKKLTKRPSSIAELFELASFPFVRIADTAKTIAPRSDNEKTVSLSAEDRAGFIYGISLGASNKARIYLTMKDVKTRELDESGNDTGYDWRTFLLYDLRIEDGAAKVVPVNTVLEVIPGTKDVAQALYAYGLTDRDDVAYNEVVRINLDNSNLPIVQPLSEGWKSSYIAARSTMHGLVERHDALKFFVEAGRTWIKKQWPDANDFVKAHGETALICLFNNIVTLPNGEGYAYYKRAEQSGIPGTLSETVTIDVPYSHYEFQMDLPSEDERAKCDAEFAVRTKVGRSYTYDVGKLCKMQEERTSLKRAIDSIKKVVQEQEMSIIYHQPDIKEFSAKRADGTVQTVHFVLTEMVNKHYTSIEHAADYCARHGVIWQPTKSSQHAADNIVANIMAVDQA